MTPAAPVLSFGIDTMPQVANDRTGGVRGLAVHSPLVGPATVRPLAAALDAVGWSTTVPDLRGALESPLHFALRAIEHAGAVDVVIGHSGAGAVLPIVADRLDAGLIFVDAVVPDARDEFQPSAPFLELIDAVPVTDGMLAPWHQWWPPEAMARLVPDDSLREGIVAEIPRLPRSFYDVAVALPPSWWTRPAAYLQLSPPYDDDRTRAERLGWPTHRRVGQHLDLAVHPDEIAGHVTQLAAAIGVA